MVTRRTFAASAPWMVSSPWVLSACSSAPSAADGSAYRALAAQIRQPGALKAQGGAGPWAAGRSTV